MTTSGLDGGTWSVAQPSAQTLLTMLLEQYEQPLYGYLLVLVGNVEVAHDCVQDTFVRAFEHLRKGKMINQQWLYKVARNRAMDYFRQGQREMTAAEPEVATTHGLDAAEPAHIRKVRRALEQMPPADRELLYLFNVDRFPTAEIAAMLGTSPGAVRVRLSRARDRFRSSYRGTP